MDQFSQLDRRKTAAFSAGRSFFPRTATFRKGSETSTENEKGPIGLTTVYKPLEKAIVDLVFVHGLGGGSRKTWSKNEDPALFWPQEWLPRDPDFRDARVHTFGYDSNWEKESILSIHDFAKSLLEWIKDCPTIPRDANVSYFWPQAQAPLWKQYAVEAATYSCGLWSLVWAWARSELTKLTESNYPCMP
jgi:hypothetical protein